MLNPLRCLILGLSLTQPMVALAEPPTASAPPSTDALDELLVMRVEMEGGEQIAAQLHPEVVASLRAAEVTSRLPEGAPLEVVISLDSKQLGAYQVVYLHRGEHIDQWSCTCSGEELLFRLRDATVQAWNSVIETAAAAEAANEPIATPSATATPGPRTRNRPPPRTLWVAGMATFVGGLGVAGGGAVWLIGSVSDESVSPLAIGLLGTGVVVTATGATLWAVGRRRLNRTRVAVSPSGYGRGLVFAVQGRF